jgi:putative transposase
MSNDYYSEIHLHFVWHTKGSRPLLTPEVEAVVHRYLRQRLTERRDVFVHEIGGTDDHIHTCVTIQPTVHISELVGQLKGSSSHEVNQKLGQGRKLLQWQTGYGVVSFGTGNLDWVKQYVRRQREHHRAGGVFDRLERITEPAP